MQSNFVALALYYAGAFLGLKTSEVFSWHCDLHSTKNNVIESTVFAYPMTALNGLQNHRHSVQKDLRAQAVRR